MPKKDYILVGEVLGVHGIKGWLAIKSYTYPAENIFKYNLYVEEGSDFKKLNITEYRIMPKKIIFQISSVNKIENAKKYISKKFFTTKDDLPSTEMDEYFWHELIERKVYNENNLEIGIVTSIFSTKSNDVLVVHKSKQEEGKEETLIPFIKDYILKVPKKEKTIIVKWENEF